MDLYRLFDVDDHLLYVGISLHAIQRASEHRRDKPWWPFVARMEFERLEVSTRAEAEEREREVIAAERPIYNISHNHRLIPSHKVWTCATCGKPVRSGFVALLCFETERSTPLCDGRTCSGFVGELPSLGELVRKSAVDPCLAVWRPCYSAVMIEAFAHFASLLTEDRSDAWHVEHSGKCQVLDGAFRIDIDDARRVAAGRDPLPRNPLAPFAALTHELELPQDPSSTFLLPFPGFTRWRR